MRRREEENLFGSSSKTSFEDSSCVIDSYKHSKRTQRTSYSLNYGVGLSLSDNGLKESRVSSWLHKPSTVGSSVRDREGFVFERSPTFSYNDRFCLKRRNSRFANDASLSDLIASSKQSVIRFKKAISDN